jgi:hypothetical protein
VTANVLATRNDPSPDAGAVSAGNPGQTATTAAGTAATMTAGSRAATAKRIQKTRKQKAQRTRSARTGRHGSRPHARGGATKPARRPSTRHASSSTPPTTTTATGAKPSGVTPLIQASKAKNPTSPASASVSGGRKGAASTSNHKAATSNHEDRGIGFNTSHGRFSISPTGFQLGGQEHSIASVGDVLSGVLDTLLALAALAAIIGAAAVLRTVRHNRLARRRRARVALAKSRTRDQLYDEAKRLNIPGRSKMTKAQLELALHPQKQLVGH